MCALHVPVAMRADFSHLCTLYTTATGITKHAYVTAPQPCKHKITEYSINLPVVDRPQFPRIQGGKRLGTMSVEKVRLYCPQQSKWRDIGPPLLEPSK